MTLDDRIFLDYTKAVTTYIELGYTLTEDKRLLTETAEVVIRKIGANMWRATVYDYFSVDPIR